MLEVVRYIRLEEVNVCVVMLVNVALPMKETVLSLDYKHSGVGSGSCGPDLADEYRAADKSFDFTFKLLPTDNIDSDPFTV